MFKLQLPAKFKHPVKFEISDETGRTAVEFDGIFLRVSQPDWDKLLAEGVKDRELLRQKMVGWERVDGEFSEANLDALLAIDGMQERIVAAFMEGNSVAPRKN